MKSDAPVASKYPDATPIALDVPPEGRRSLVIQTPIDVYACSLCADSLSSTEAGKYLHQRDLNSHFTRAKCGGVCVKAKATPLDACHSCFRAFFSDKQYRSHRCKRTDEIPRNSSLTRRSAKPHGRPLKSPAPSSVGNNDESEEESSSTCTDVHKVVSMSLLMIYLASENLYTNTGRPMRDTVKRNGMFNSML